MDEMVVLDLEEEEDYGFVVLDWQLDSSYQPTNKYRSQAHPTHPSSSQGGWTDLCCRQHWPQGTFYCNMGGWEMSYRLRERSPSPQLSDSMSKVTTVRI